MPQVKIKKFFFYILGVKANIYIYLKKNSFAVEKSTRTFFSQISTFARKVLADVNKYQILKCLLAIYPFLQLSSNNIKK